MFIRSHKTKALPFCLPETAEAVDHFARLDVEERGAIFTRREVVEFILDLSEYTVDRPLHRLRLLEPAFGDGDFLEAVVERLLLEEMIPDVLMAEYRARFATIYDRADLYVPFIEHCLNGLQPGGVLGFICADRWMKNKYGGPLRKMIARGHHLLHYVDMVETQAFNTDVITYPTITILKKEKRGPTRIAHRPPIDRNKLSELAQAMKSEPTPGGVGVIEVSGGGP